MSATNIVFAEGAARDALRNLRLASPSGKTVENVVYAFARCFAHGGRAVLRVERIETFTHDEYAVREPFAVRLRPEALARVVSIAKKTGLVSIKLHRHIPALGGGIPRFSGTDDIADSELAGLFGSDSFASVLLADEEGGAYQFLGRTVAKTGTFVPAAVIEACLPLRVHGPGARADFDSPRFARARLEFGAGIVNGLGELRVGVMGCGGLGWRSATAAADSGVGSLLLVDRDDVEHRNVLRLEAATDDDVGKAKVVALAAYLRRRHPDMDVAPLKLDVVDALDSNGSDRHELIQAIGSCDVLLLVTDNHPSRLSVLIEAERLGLPYVHCGMHAITPHDMFCRLSVHVPRVNPCSVCAKNVDRSEGSRRGHGYIKGVDLPNVAAWNTIAAGYVANAVRMLAVPLAHESLRDCSAWELGLSRPSVRPMRIEQDPQCAVCGNTQCGSEAAAAILPWCGKQRRFSCETLDSGL